MTDQPLSSADFPSFHHSVRASWAPVLLEPIAGSLERLVVAVAVVSGDGFHLEIANRLERLRCLYSDNASGPMFVIKVAVAQLKQELATRGIEALAEPRPVISGIAIGPLREAEGKTLEKIGASWMQMLSSLYKATGDDDLQLDSEFADELIASGDGRADRLPVLVLDYVSTRRDGLRNFFRHDLQEGRRRRMSGRSHEVMIDFSGSRLVANFGTLHSLRISKSMDIIKRRLWDLEICRGRGDAPFFYRNHEMILQKPRPDDPQVSKKQYANIEKAVEELEGEADQQQLRLRTFNTVAEIGEHVLALEAA